MVAGLARKQLLDFTQKKQFLTSVSQKTTTVGFHEEAVGGEGNQSNDVL